MSGYGRFAYFYDALTKNVDYPARVDRILGFFRKYGITDGILLDAACGTGSMAELFCAAGFEVVGADASEEMLGEALNKKYESGSDILYLNQDIRSLDLFGSIRCAVCCLDSLNHLPTAQDLFRAIHSVGFFMEKDGIFVFDVNTEFKHKTVLADNTFVYDLDEIYCVWQNSYDCEAKRTDIRLDLFIPGDDGLYEREEEAFSEYVYSDAVIRECAERANFRVEEVCGEEADPVREDEQRVYYICRKLRDQ